jgi:uridine kinase
LEERLKLNFDEPAAIEWELLVEQLKQLKAGKAIEQPTYSYLTCTRQDETVHVEPRDIIIVEGILILCDEQLRNMLDIKVFVDADSDERLIRVINRDIIERGRTVDMVIERYERVLRPMHLQHIEPTKRYADLIIPQGGHNKVAIEMMKDFISHKLNR